MKIINSQKLNDTTTNTGYRAIFEGGLGDETVVVTDGRITNEAAARERAYAELLKAGYTKTKLRLSIPFDAKIEVNSIISVTAPSRGIPRSPSGERFIVKEIEIVGEPSSVIMNLEVERYD